MTLLYVAYSASSDQFCLLPPYHARAPIYPRGAKSTVVKSPADAALEALRRGETAAVALVAGTPAPLFCDLIGENGWHFLSIPADAAVNAGYLPARLTAAVTLVSYRTTSRSILSRSAPCLHSPSSNLVLNTTAMSPISLRHSLASSSCCSDPVIILNGTK